MKCIYHKERNNVWKTLEKPDRIGLAATNTVFIIDVTTVLKTIHKLAGDFVYFPTSYDICQYLSDSVHFLTFSDSSTSLNSSKIEKWRDWKGVLPNASLEPYAVMGNLSYPTYTHKTATAFAWNTFNSNRAVTYFQWQFYPTWFNSFKYSCFKEFYSHLMKIVLSFSARLTEKSSSTSWPIKCQQI